MDKYSNNLAEVKYSQQMAVPMMVDDVLPDGIGAFAGSVGPFNYFVDADLNFENLVDSNFKVKLSVLGVNIVDISLDANNPKATIDLSVSGIGIIGEVGIDFDSCRIYCSASLNYLIGSKRYNFDIYHWGNNSTDMIVHTAADEGMSVKAVANDSVTAFMMALQGSKGGSITVRNEGGYVAQFAVSYCLNGKQITKKSGDFTRGVNKSIEIPADATDISLKIEAAWFIKSWTTIKTFNFEKPVNKRFKISGTTFDTSCEEL